MKGAPANLPHLTERFCLFVIIAFGESLVSIVTILVGKTTEPPTLLFALLCFSIISLMWASYFFAYENQIDHHLTTNGQVLLYGHFAILVSVMLLAGDIELLYEHHLKDQVLLFFLYGPVALFYLSKGLVFFYHRKRDQIESRYLREFIPAAAISVLAFVNEATGLSLIVNLLLVAIFCGLEIFLRQGRHRRLGQWLRI